MRIPGTDCDVYFGDAESELLPNWREGEEDSGVDPEPFERDYLVGVSGVDPDELFPEDDDGESGEEEDVPFSPPPLPNRLPTTKSLEKGKGTCKPGQRSDLTHCTPAGEENSEGRPSDKVVDQQRGGSKRAPTTRKQLPLVFHGTSARFLSSIKKRGLQGLLLLGGKSDAVFTTVKYGVAIDYALQTSHHPDDRIAVITVDARGGVQIPGSPSYRAFPQGVPPERIMKVDIYRAEDLRHVKSRARATRDDVKHLVLNKSLSGNEEEVYATVILHDNAVMDIPNNLPTAGKGNRHA